MEWSTVESRWEDFKASAKLRWGKLSVAQINGIEGKRDELLQRICEAYALTQEEAERQVAEWQVRYAHKHLPVAEG